MRSELNWNMEVHNMPKRIWYFCAHVARNVTRHQKDRHLSSPENSHRRKSESELQRQRAKDFPIMIAGKCAMWVNISSLPIPIENDQTSPQWWITAQITVDLYGGTVSIVQHFLYTKISVQSKMLAHEHSFVSSETPGWRWLATWLPPPEWMIAVRRTWAMGEVCKMLLVWNRLMCIRCC